MKSGGRRLPIGSSGKGQLKQYISTRTSRSHHFIKRTTRKNISVAYQRKSGYFLGDGLVLHQQPL